MVDMQPDIWSGPFEWSPFLMFGELALATAMSATVVVPTQYLTLYPSPFLAFKTAPWVESF